MMEDEMGIGEPMPGDLPDTDETILVRKLARIAGELKYVQKTGRNQAQNYSFAKEGDFKAALKPLLEREGIALTTSTCIVGEPVHIGDSKSTGTAQWMTTVHMTGYFRYRASAVRVEAVGQGVDPGDKGVYKAQAGALKYLISSNFQIETGDDPEKDNDLDAPEAPPARPAALQAPVAPPPQASGSMTTPAPRTAPDGNPWPADDFVADLNTQIQRLGSEKVLWVTENKFGAAAPMAIPEEKRRSFIGYLKKIEPKV